ncbi:MAG: hypothetical protein GY874_18355 [Desulfobacteraceae bacterium]|nr:hypothetical protein [Desulfobacteraceae bacterium]
MKKKLLAILLVFFVICIMACGGYYKVKDIETNKIYYSKELKMDDGTVILKDANTGNIVNINNSEIIKINKEEFLGHTKVE